MIEIKSPDTTDFVTFKKIFLAGSIEMGAAVDWQKEVADFYKDHKRLILLSPRRDDWDSTWKQDPSPGTPFTEQVLWELNHLLKKADIALFNFDPKTKSVVTLLELGLCIGMDKKIYVCCPDGYFRKGNVVLTCNLRQIPVYNTLQEMLISIDI